MACDLALGSLVLDNDHRHPVVLAKEAATLDLLSDRYGFSNQVVADGDMDTFAPVVDHLAGR